MEAPEKEDADPSVLGAFFGRVGGTSSDDSRGGPLWDSDAARPQRNAEELAEQGIFGDFAERALTQVLGNEPSAHQEIPLRHRPALSQSQPLAKAVH